MFKKISAFFAKYPTYTHVALAIWNLFIVSWATKISVPVTQFGMSFTINASAIVSKIQAFLHLPTAAVAVLTLALNGYVAYQNFRAKAAAKTN